jgi:xylulokinase
MAHQETAGLCLEWFKNMFFSNYNYSQLDEMVKNTNPGADGILFTPWLYGERCPLNDDYVRAGFYNISLDHTQNHILRAVYEGIALNTRWAMETLENLYQKVSHLNIIGGGAKSDMLCQIFADITNRKIQRIEDPQQAGAKGIALLASMSLGYIKSFSDIKNYIKIEKIFLPNSDNRQLYDELFIEYKKLYKQNKNWYKRMNKDRFRLGGC